MASRRARDLRQNSTDTEQRLWAALRRKQLDGHRFRRQVPLGPYVVDFACLRAKLVVEVDGRQHADRSEHDARRDRWLASRGYRVLRFWNSEVAENFDGVLAAIRTGLR